MKKIVLILLVTVLTSSLVSASDLQYFRKSFYKASTEQAACESVYNKIKDKDYSSDPVLLGYQGVYQAIMAKYVWNPFTKLWYFQNGTQDLEAAIKRDEKNIELIFLRFSIQISSPSFLGYNDNIKEDKAYIMNGIFNKETRDKYHHFIPDIINYMAGTNYVTEDEKERMMKVKKLLEESGSQS